MPDATVGERAAAFARPDLSSFCSLVVTGQHLEPGRAVIAYRVPDPGQGCRRCGCEGTPRDMVTRQLTHEPLGWRPTVLVVAVRRYRCTGCGHLWHQNTSRAAESRSKVSRRGLRWALESIVVTHLTIDRVAAGLGVAWNAANDAVLAEGERVLIDDSACFEGVKVVGVDEHVWRHSRRSDRCVSVVIDLTALRDGTRSARLLEMVEGPSKEVFKTWLVARPQRWREAVEVVAMDGFIGFKTATTEELPDAVAVMDPFHVVRLAGDALDRCRRRVQQAIHGRRGHKSDPFHVAFGNLCTGAGLLTDKQTTRLQTLFADDQHVEVEATWEIYQRVVPAYRHEDRRPGRDLMATVSVALSNGIPKALIEPITLGWTLKKRADDVLAYFDRPGASNGPTEAIHGRFEHLLAPRAGSATSPTASPAACSRPEASGLDYTLDYEEPVCRRCGHGVC